MSHKPTDQEEPDTYEELTRLATVAEKQGKTSIAAICRRALAALAQLEADLHITRSVRQRAGHARAAHLTADRRKEIASDAAKQRWLRRRAS